MRIKYLTLGVLFLLSFQLIHAEWATVSIEDPSGDIRGTANASMYESGGTDCPNKVIGAVQDVANTDCDWKYDLGKIYDEEGTWEADVYVFTRDCEKTSCQSGWSSCVTPCSGSDLCCENKERSKFTIWTIDWDTNSGDCTGHGDDWFTAVSGGTGGSCCGDDTTSDDFFNNSGSLTTSTSSICTRCQDGVKQTPETRYGNGYWTGTTCYYGDISCTSTSSSSGTSGVTLCSSGDSMCCLDQTQRVEGVSCSDGSYNTGTAYDRDTSQARCEDGSSTGCTAKTWATAGLFCCGDDGASENTEAIGSGNSCCINGALVTNGTLDATNQYMCLDGEIYGCNGDLGGVATSRASCYRESQYYCNGTLSQNDWELQITVEDTQPEDCDGTTDNYYGEGHTTYFDQETCKWNSVYNDAGNGISNQDTGWKCTSWRGPFIADCSLSQVGSALTLHVEVADEAHSATSGGYVFRMGSYDTITDTTYYADAGYPGTIHYNPSYSSYSGIDANEGTYGDYFDVAFDWSALTTTITNEGTYYTEVGLEETSGAACGTQTCNSEDPNDNEGSCTTSTTLCVPTSYSATSDSDCCPIGATTSEYPGKDDEDGVCIRCNTQTNEQIEGVSGNNVCEVVCGASSACDELDITDCPTMGTVCGSTCISTDRDYNQTYCESSGSGCTASGTATWLSSAGLCCGDDTTSDDFDNEGIGNSCCIDGGVLSHGSLSGSYSNTILCYDGRVRSCNNEFQYAFDSDYSTGAKIGSKYCNATEWSDIASDYDTSKNSCESGGFTWFGGDGEKGCCESGEEFVYGGVREEGLNLYFKFDEAGGSNKTYDSQSGEVGDLIGDGIPLPPTIVTSSSSVVEGNAMSFDGVDDYINVKDDNLLKLDKNLTIAFWMKPNNVGTARINPIDKNYGGEFAFTIETSGSLSFYHGTQRVSGYYTSFNALDPGMVKNGVWQFVVVTRNVETRNLTSYYDGRMQNTAPYSSNTNYWPSVSTYPVTIGDGYVNNFGGVLDEVMLWNRTLTPEEVLLLYRSFPEFAQPDLLGYFELDENTGSTTQDGSKYADTGTFQGDTSWDSSKVGVSSVHFDGNGDYISFSDADLAGASDTELSVSAWINLTGQFSGTDWFAGEGAAFRVGITNNDEVQCWIKGNNSTASDTSDSTTTTSSPIKYKNTWYHVVCTWDGNSGDRKIYVNGQLVQDGSTNVVIFNGDSNNFALGAGYSGSTEYFNGSVDDLRVYNKSLTQDEIQYLYNLESWNKYACENGVETSCSGGDECTKNITDTGIAYYCSGGYFVDYRSVVDTCNGACTDQGGTWLGGGGDENCCISATELWCNETVGVDTLCYGGLTYQCDFWCDVLGTVSGQIPYSCTSGADGDCTSSQTCTASESCECFKSQGTTCNLDSECGSGNCEAYVAESINQPSLGSMYGGASKKVCCIEGYCAYDRLTPAGEVDSCAVNTSVSVDADKDGDLDYCLNGLWKECDTLISASGRANECGCIGAGITINKSGGWYCRAPPVNLTYDGLSCGTACDSDSDLTNIEVVDNNGQCIEPEISCSEILPTATWTGNTSQIVAEVEVNCPCAEDATCTFSVDSNGERAFTQFSASDGVTTYQDLSPNFAYGENNVSISCTCNVVPAACSSVTPAVVSTDVKVIDNDCVAGKSCNTQVNLTNLGNINSNNSLTLNTYKLSSLLFSNWSSSLLLGGSSNIFSFTNNFSCDWYQPTWISGEGNQELIYESLVNLSQISGTVNTNLTGNLIQCESNSDCTTCCSAGTNCWLNSSDQNDFACSDGVCCPSNEHFQNGACCIASERCCLSDTSCNTGEWCDNITSGLPQGNFICKDKKNIGQGCVTDRECESEYCGNGICSDPEPVALSEWYECNPYLSNDYCSYESVSGTYLFDPVGCNLDSECSGGFYCYLPRRACLECAGPDTVYGSLNISDDGLCPSISCVGSDLDCCTTDTDCTNNEWCDASASCATCSDRSDSVCSSSVCVGTDPDCCSIDSDCSEGLKCVSNTCTGNVGESCSTNSTCTGGLSCLGGVCSKTSFIVLSPQEETYNANLGETLKLTLVVNDPQNKQDKYTVSVDQSYIPDSAYVSIDGVKSESFELGAGEVRKFLVSVSAAKIKEGSPDILTVIHVNSDDNPYVSDSATLKVDVNPITTGNIPAAPLDSWFAILLIGFIIGIVKN